MSKLSQQINKLKDSFSDIGSQPLKKLANLATLGQTDKLRDLYNSSGLANFYNNNKSTILNAAAMGALGGLGGELGAAALGSNSGAAIGLGALGGTVAGGLAGQSQDKARAYNQSQLNAKSNASNDLQNILNGINNPGATSPTTPTPSFNPSQPYADGGLALKPGSIPFDSLPPDQQQLLAQQSPALQARLQQIIGPGTGSAQTSASQILNANDLTKTLNQQTLDQQATARKQQISDLSNLLTEQAKTQYERQLPGLYEDLNTRGLLRSSDLGNQMALKEQQSFQDVANQLAQQQLGYNDQYISGLGNINNQYTSGIGSALQREQSLQDFVTQTNAAKALGQAVAPIQPYNGKNSTTAVTNALGAASLGSNLGGKASSASRNA